MPPAGCQATLPRCFTPPFLVCCGLSFYLFWQGFMFIGCMLFCCRNLHSVFSAISAVCPCSVFTSARFPLMVMVALIIVFLLESILLVFVFSVFCSVFQGFLLWLVRLVARIVVDCILCVLVLLSRFWLLGCLVLF